MQHHVRALVIAFSLLVGLLAHNARGQLVPLTLDVSGVLNTVDATAYPGVTSGTAYSITYDLMVEIGAPSSQDATSSVWDASGEVTLTIDGMAPIVASGVCPIRYNLDPFGDERDLIEFVFNIPPIPSGFRIVQLITDNAGDLDLNAAPSASVINALPPGQQVVNTFGFYEQDTNFVQLLRGNITSFNADGGGPPPAPVITTQPVGDIVTIGDVVNFTIRADGLDLEYQWFKDGVRLTDGPGVAGSTGSRLQITADKSARYSCLVSNPGGSETSVDAILAVENDCPADQNNDGMLSPTDFNAWIANYNLGC